MRGSRGKPERLGLAKKAVTVTGGARGIGAAIATELARRGANVVIGDIDVDEARATAAAAKSERGEVHAQPLDVASASSWVDFLDTSESLIGPIDIHINNAGIMPLVPFLDEDADTTLRIFEVNTIGVILGTRTMGRRMAARGCGHILNVASTAGKKGVAGGASYCASKSAVLTFDQAARAELGAFGIELTSVLPGIVRTDLSHGVRDVPGIPSVAPTDVAAAVVTAITRPKPEVYVPSIAGPVLRYSGLIPARLLSWATQRAGADHFLLDAARDPSRAEYEDRVRRRP